MRLATILLLGIVACEVGSTSELDQRVAGPRRTAPSDDPTSPVDARRVAAGGDGASTPGPISSTPLTAGAWLSGAAGDDVATGEFAKWRGSPVSIAGTWNDANKEVQEQQWTVSGVYGSWGSALDLAVGAFWDGSWSDAAGGASDDSWHKAMQSIARARSGKPGQVYVRLAHEMNGSWYKWKVTPNDSSSFKEAWRRFVDIARTELPSVKIVFGANNGTSGGNASIPDIWPGDDVVDVVGVDFYDMWPSYTDEAIWTSQYMATDAGNSPRGIGAWLAFAKQHGKPLAFPEWGINWAEDASTGPQDNPLFIQKMNDFFRANAGTGAGQVLYEIYYNINDVKAQLHPVASNPKSADRYASLVWGK